LRRSLTFPATRKIESKDSYTGLSEGLANGNVFHAVFGTEHSMAANHYRGRKDFRKMHIGSEGTD
jgi:hypothetical protein